MKPPLAARNSTTAAISQLPYFLAKSRARSRRRFSSTSRRKVSLISGGCAKDVPQSARSGNLRPVAPFPTRDERKLAPLRLAAEAAKAKGSAARACARATPKPKRSDAAVRAARLCCGQVHVPDD